MNNKIITLQKRQTKIVRYRACVTKQLDKENPLFNIQLNRIDKFLERIGRMLKDEYNKLYIK